jgi:hypothetical protein
MSSVMQCVDVSDRRPPVALKYNMWPERDLADPLPSVRSLGHYADRLIVVGRLIPGAPPSKAHSWARL